MQPRSRDIRCVLIDPCRRVVNIVQDGDIKKAAEEFVAYPPVGLAYIAAFLRQNGIDVSIIDAKSLNIPHKQVAEAVAKEQPDLVGVTVFTSNLKSALDTCREIKERCPSTRVVVGGPHIDPQHKEVIGADFIDFCARQEGEVTMLELARAISNGTDLKQVRGITFKEGDDIVVTADRPFIEDLDTLPFPARDLLPNHIYKAALGGGETRKFAAVSAQRGCPFRCQFCAVPEFYPTQRRRSVRNILDELEEICEVYGIEYVRFTDEILPLNRNWAMKLFSGMIERGLNKKIAWSCDNRVDLVTEDLLEKMKEANCQVIFYGIEFGNQRILDLSGKNTTIDQIRKAVDMTRRVGITATGNFMIGYPTETRETIEDTIALAKSLHVDNASFSIVTPFPGTQLYRYCRENNLLRSDNWEEYSYFHPQRGIIKLADVSDEELINLYRKANFEYTFRQVSDELKRELSEMAPTIGPRGGE